MPRNFYRRKPNICRGGAAASLRKLLEKKLNCGNTSQHLQVSETFTQGYLCYEYFFLVLLADAFKQTKVRGSVGSVQLVKIVWKVLRKILKRFDRLEKNAPDPEDREE